MSTIKGAALTAIVEAMRHLDLPVPVTISPPAGRIPADVQLSRDAVEEVDAWGAAIGDNGSVVTEISQSWMSYTVAGQLDGHAVRAWCAVSRHQSEAEAVS